VVRHLPEDRLDLIHVGLTGIRPYYGESALKVGCSPQSYGVREFGKLSSDQWFQSVECGQKFRVNRVTSKVVEHIRNFRVLSVWLKITFVNGKKVASLPRLGRLQQRLQLPKRILRLQHLPDCCVFFPKLNREHACQSDRSGQQKKAGEGRNKAPPA
jgi:hypothetical protein